MILAGGRAQRMGGRDKALIPLAGAPLIGHVIARMRGQAGEMAISANGDAERFADFGLPVLPDPLADWPGPLAGVLAAMEWARGRGAASVLSVPCDTPLLPVDLGQRLQQAGPFSMARTADGAQPACALWPVDLAAPLRQVLMAGQRKVMRFAQGHDVQMVDFLDAAAFTNINTADDLASAARLL